MRKGLGNFAERPLRKFSPPFKGDDLRHRIIAVPAPGMAAQDAPECQIEPFYGAVLLECFNGILATGRGEAA